MLICEGGGRGEGVHTGCPHSKFQQLLEKKGVWVLSSPRNLTEKDKNRCSIVTCSGSFLRNILLASTRNHREEKGKIYYFLLCKSWAQFTWRLQYCDVREFLQAAQCKEMEKRCQIVSSPSVFLDWIPDFTSTTSLSLALNPHPTTGVSGRASITACTGFCFKILFPSCPSVFIQSTENDWNLGASSLMEMVLPVLKSYGGMLC